VFAYNSTASAWGAVTPYYLSNGVSGAQYVDLHNAGTAVPINNLVGFRPDSAASDNGTQLAVLPDEGSGNNYIFNFFGLPSTLPASLSLPATSFNIPPGVMCALRPDWTLVNIEQNSHILFSGQEFADCIAATQLPSLPVADASGNPVAPSPPTQLRFGRISAQQVPYQATPPWGDFTVTGADPDGNAWANSGDPHLFTTFTSVLTGKPTGLVAEDTSLLGGLWLAEVSMNDFLNFSGNGFINPPSSLGEVDPQDMGMLTTFVRVSNPLPQISTLNPASAAHRSRDIVVTVSGFGFVTDSYVVYNGVPAATTFVSKNQLTFTVTQSELLNPIGSYNVTVHTPAPLTSSPSGADSFPFAFQIVYAVPSITSLSPSPTPKATAVTVSVIGTGFETAAAAGGGTVVIFNGVQKTPTFISADGTYLTFAVAATDIPNTGNYTVEVFNPAPGGGSASAQLVVQ
jgi:hypothetical protein